MSKLWYLLQYHYGQASRAIMNLEHLGVNCFSPRVNGFYPGRNKKNGDEDKHLFPPYLFVEFDPEEVQYATVQHTPGVYNFVRFGQALKAVPVSVIDRLLNPVMAEHTDQYPLLSDILRCHDKKLRTVMFLSLMEKAQNGGEVRLRMLN